MLDKDGILLVVFDEPRLHASFSVFETEESGEIVQVTFDHYGTKPNTEDKIMMGKITKKLASMCNSK